MKLIIGGSIAIILAVVGLGVYFSAFLKFLAGIVPITLLLGGGLALYLYREMRRDESDVQPQSCCEDKPDGSGATAASHREPEVWKPESMKSDASESQPPAAPAPDPGPQKDGAPVEEKPATASEVPAPAAERVEEASAEPETPAPVALETETAQKNEKESVAPADGKFVGNTDSMVFHTAACQYSKAKKCTAVFNTAQEAQDAGYKACGVCKPE